MSTSRPPMRLLSSVLLSFLAIPLALAQVPENDADRQAMIDLGLQHNTAESLFEALKEMANGGTGVTANSMPDWFGIYTTDLSGGLVFDPMQGRGDLPTANLTPEFHESMLEKIELANQGIEFDPLGRCVPPGTPRGMSEPFLKEFIITPNQTWLINEVANEIRRIYTDGREHFPAEDRYPTYDGDSIGFWDNDKLVIHTNQLSSGQYQRSQPDYTEEIELVEIWQEGSNDELIVHVWAYDPPALIEPWYVTKTYSRLSNEDKQIRIHYWHCLENQNNDVIETEEGATQFLDFNFTSEDDK